jgi:hypothetical protein
MAFLIEESVSVVGNDREDCDLGDRAVGYPRRTLPVDDDVTAADLGGQVPFVALRGARMSFGG